LREVAPGVSVEDVQKATEPALLVPSPPTEMQAPI
jgi:acyl CoA:acetate/3-ketoacid CoA transferase beta subunit